MDMMLIIGVLLIIFGIYCMIISGKIKSGDHLPNWLVNEKEAETFREPEKFGAYMYRKTCGFGICSLIYGIYSVVVSILSISQMFDTVGIIVFLFIVIWYLAELKKAKSLYA